MTIKSLRVQNFRKHRDYKIEFKKNTTIITGENGIGKTSLIEAIYIALTGKSWRSNFAEIIRRKCDWWRVDIEFSNGEKRIVKFKNGQKTFQIGGKEYSRLPAEHKIPTILFEPSDLNLLYGSPARRRDYFDRFISGINPTHQKNINKYERILKQRNSLLKDNAKADELFIWDIQFADLAAEIILARTEMIEKINKIITHEYQKIAGKKDKVEVKYSFPVILRVSRSEMLQNPECDSAIKNHLRTVLLSDLHKNYQRELILGHTTIGPHQHDILFSFNNKPAAETASRGEIRTIIWALKNIEYQFNFEKSPLVLLDDILSEFDENHQNNLIKSFKGQQIIITGVKPPKTRKNLAIINIV